MNDNLSIVRRTFYYGEQRVWIPTRKGSNSRTLNLHTHSEGNLTTTSPSGIASPAEGENTITSSGLSSDAKGQVTRAQGNLRMPKRL